jgi:nuclear pore complex protein Nup188
MIDFKRTPLVSRTLGSDYYYDLSMGQKLLSFDFAWTGGSRNQGFAEEFARANINLSLVEAQVVSFSVPSIVRPLLGITIANTA